MKTFVIADTHFFHKNIIDYCNRPFADVEDMNRALVARWNRVVSKNDRVYMLGDFALGSKDKIIEIGNQLNGQKTLILGNHDRASLQTYYDAGFRIVSEHPIIVREFIILSHAPMLDSLDKSGFINIYGHVHDSPDYDTIGPVSACVSCERINYTPIEIDTLISQIQRKNEQERPS